MTALMTNADEQDSDNEHEQESYSDDFADQDDDDGQERPVSSAYHPNSLLTAAARSSYRYESASRRHWGPNFKPLWLSNQSRY